MNSKFENYIRESLQNYEAEVPENAWENISSALQRDAVPKPGNNNSFLKGLGIVGLGLALVSAVYLFSDIDEKGNERISERTSVNSETTGNTIEESNGATLNSNEEVRENTIGNFESPSPILHEEREVILKASPNKVITAFDIMENPDVVDIEKMTVDNRNISPIILKNTPNFKELAQPKQEISTEEENSDVTANAVKAQIKASAIEGYAPMEVVFNTEDDHIQHYWDLGNGSSFYGSTVKTEYKNAGIYTVRVNTVDGNGNESSDMITVEVKEASNLYIPNSFSPNGDRINDYFKAEGSNIKQFSMAIYARSGDMIFQTQNINEGWDGKTGVRNQSDSYFAIVKATGEDGEIYSEKIDIIIFP